MIHVVYLIVGVIAGLAARALLVQLILMRFRRDVRRLNAGDYRPLLAGYARDAVLRFHEGAHRWSGQHRGKAAIERFFRDFTGAGVQGEIQAIWIAGPPWAMRIVVRFDDRATSPEGDEIYSNRAVIVARTRWGKIVEHEDFCEDTVRLVEFEAKLREHGIRPAQGSGSTGV